MMSQGGNVHGKGDNAKIPVLTDKTRQATEESVRNTGSYGQNLPTDKVKCP